MIRLSFRRSMIVVYARRFETQICLCGTADEYDAGGGFWLGFGLKRKGKSQAINPAFICAVGDSLVFR
jgi:hypothetical protein